jgi:hypothetical protein
MASLDTLPPDQRAVLDLVLQRGRSYDDIAQLLGIDRAAVRARALAAFDVLGPETGIAPESRALITDYLLGQLPERVAEQVRERLAQSPYDRAWARVVASGLESVASQPLPEIPDSSRTHTPSSDHPSADEERSATEVPIATEPAATRAREPRRRDRGTRRPPRLSDRPSSRRGGAIMLGVGVLVVVAVVVVLLTVLSGSSSTHSSSASVASTPTSTPATSTGTTGATGTSSAPKAQVVAQINLNPPNGGTAKGVGLVVKEGNLYGIVIEAQHVAPNSHNAYAAWLYNSSSDNDRLGFVNPAVGKNGQFEVGNALPTNAGRFKQLVVSLETTTNPKSPTKIVLAGAFKGVPAPASG